jgi:hypothetical protein
MVGGDRIHIPYGAGVFINKDIIEPTYVYAATTNKLKAIYYLEQ